MIDANQRLGKRPTMMFPTGIIMKYVRKIDKEKF